MGRGGRVVKSLSSKQERPGSNPGAAKFLWVYLMFSMRVYSLFRFVLINYVTALR